MNIKELLKDLSHYNNIYKNFKDFDIYVEQCSEDDKNYKRSKIQNNCQEWGIIGCGDNGDDEAFKIEGGMGVNLEKKYVIFYVNF